jgi:hypothetical protein
MSELSKEAIGLNIPHHINHQLLGPHHNLFEDLLPAILRDMVFRHHSIRLDKLAMKLNEE